MNQVARMQIFGSKFGSGYFLSMKVRAVQSSSTGGTRHKSKDAVHTNYNMNTVFIF